MQLLSNSIGRTAAAGMLATICVQFGSFAAQAADQPRELLIFGANWCGPCRAELRDLDRFAQLVHPGRVAVVWLDGPPRLRAVRLPDNVRIVLGPDAKALFDGLGSVGAGLPLAIMRNNRGAICAVVKRRLRPADVADVLTKCSG